MEISKLRGKNIMGNKLDFVQPKREWQTAVWWPFLSLYEYHTTSPLINPMGSHKRPISHSPAGEAEREFSCRQIITGKKRCGVQPDSCTTEKQRLSQKYGQRYRLWQKWKVKKGNHQNDGRDTGRGEGLCNQPAGRLRAIRTLAAHMHGAHTPWWEDWRITLVIPSTSPSCQTNKS